MKIAIVLAGLVLAGCSSAPKVSAEKPAYCITNQTTILKNGEKVESQTVLECTDDQIKRIAQKRLGSSPYCGEFTYWMQIGGNNVQRKGISCQKPDGSWEVINTVGY